ncbi:MAG: undecaprenyl-diphosphatase UppP [Acidobacteriota bacterium]
MNPVDALILGIVQGLTEFIPVSSTAHLVFALRWLGIYHDDPLKQTATMAVIQMGTLVAAIVYFGRDIRGITTAFIRENADILKRQRSLQWDKFSSEARLGWLLIIGSIPIGAAGILFKKQIEGVFTKNLMVIASMMIVIAIALAVAERIGSQVRSINSVSLKDALIVGLAQALALIPGASRSGSTIMGGLFSGLNRESAARFSFLLMIPAVAASGILEMREALKVLSMGDLSSLVLGTIAAGISGYLAIWFLLSYLRSRTTVIFIVYRVVVGALIIFLIKSGWMAASVN